MSWFGISLRTYSGVGKADARVGYPGENDFVFLPIVETHSENMPTSNNTSRTEEDEVYEQRQCR